MRNANHNRRRAGRRLLALVLTGLLAGSSTAAATSPDIGSKDMGGGGASPPTAQRSDEDRTAASHSAGEKTAGESGKHLAGSATEGTSGNGSNPTAKPGQTSLAAQAQECETVLEGQRKRLRLDQLCGDQPQPECEIDRLAQQPSPRVANLMQHWLTAGRPGQLALAAMPEGATCIFTSVLCPSDEDCQSSRLGSLTVSPTRLPGGPKSTLSVAYHPSSVVFGRVSLAIVGYSPKGELLFSYRRARIHVIPSWAPFFFTAIITILLYVLIAKASNGSAYATQFSWLNPVRITAGNSSSASLSQMQLFVFSMLIFSLLVYQLAADGVLWGVSSSVLILLGIKSGSAGLARFVAETQSKTALSTSAREFVQTLGWFSGPRAKSTASDTGRSSVAAAAAARSLRFSDGNTGRPTLQERFELTSLLVSGNHFNPFKLQKLLFGIITTAYLLIRGFGDELKILDIPDELLFLSGVGDLIYIGSKGFASRIDILENRIQSMMRLLEKYSELLADTEAREHYKTLYEQTAVQAASDFRRLFGLEVTHPACCLPPPASRPAEERAPDGQSITNTEPAPSK